MPRSSRSTATAGDSVRHASVSSMASGDMASGGSNGWGASIDAPRWGDVHGLTPIRCGSGVWLPDHPDSTASSATLLAPDARNVPSRSQEKTRSLAVSTGADAWRTTLHGHRAREKAPVTRRAGSSVTGARRAPRRGWGTQRSTITRPDGAPVRRRSHRPAARPGSRRAAPRSPRPARRPDRRRTGETRQAARRKPGRGPRRPTP